MLVFSVGPLIVLSVRGSIGLLGSNIIWLFRRAISGFRVGGLGSLGRLILAYRSMSMRVLVLRKIRSGFCSRRFCLL